MPSTIHTPICIQHDLPISESVLEKAFTSNDKYPGHCNKVTNQRVDMQELSPGLFLLHSEMTFNRETELREEYPESGVFQLSFCLNGCMEWDFDAGKDGHYEISPTECSLQCGRFSRCSSYYKPGETENLFPCVSYYIRDSIGAATSCRLPSGAETEENILGRESFGTFVPVLR